MASTDQSGFTGRTQERGGHYHDGSWYTDDECQCKPAYCQGITPAPDKIGEAYMILCAVTAQAARGALSQGLSADDVAQELESLADAIRDPGTVAENMYAIPQIPRVTWEAAGVDFSEAE